MNNIIRLLLLVLALSVAMLGIFSCVPNSEDPDDPGEAPGTPSEDGDGNEDVFRMKAKITAMGDRIEVDVIEAPYTSGIHWVIANELTDIRDENGERIERSELAVGDVVEIEYNGQVMMSYPPQIAALSIKVLSRA